jgi:hypothetical protein
MDSPKAVSSSFKSKYREYNQREAGRRKRGRSSPSPARHGGREGSPSRSAHKKMKTLVQSTSEQEKMFGEDV